MKSLLVALSLVIGFSATQAFATPVSCGELAAVKTKLASELEWLKTKINNSRNSDVIELYMDQYEALYAAYLNADAKIENNCK